MKETIYTIPVTDGFNEGGECPFCNMYKTLDDASVDYMLGPAYMEDDIRMNTDEIGFCKEHYDKMSKKQNVLGLALMLHTHFLKVTADLEKIAKSQKPASQKSGLPFMKKKAASEGSTVSDHLYMLNDNCYICNRINGTFFRYIDTFFYLWKQNDEMGNKVKEGNGFCFKHFAMLLEKGREALNQQEYDKFYEVLFTVQLESMKRLCGELDWFIKKFDYRYANEPWGTAQDAVERAVVKASGK